MKMASYDRSIVRDRSIRIIATLSIFAVVIVLAWNAGLPLVAAGLALATPIAISRMLVARAQIEARLAPNKEDPAAQLALARASDAGVNKFMLRIGGTVLRSILVFAAFGVYVMNGGAFEVRTMAAMALRTTVWLVIGTLAWRMRPGRD